jgi:hypothetical protein
VRENDKNKAVEKHILYHINNTHTQKRRKTDKEKVNRQKDKKTTNPHVRPNS